MSDPDGRPVPGMEHERKFLVAEPQILRGHTGYAIRQAYLWSAAGYEVRVRQSEHRGDPSPIDHGDPGPAFGAFDGPAFLTLKGPRGGDMFGRMEIEEEIPANAAAIIVANADRVITKTRFSIVSSDTTFEVDEFHGKNRGLVLAEFEGTPASVALLKEPWWSAKDVTDDPRYSNAYLAEFPWTEWSENLQ